jgi:histidine ammonia-lyase
MTDTKPYVRLDGTSLSLADVERVVRERHLVDMSDGAWERIREARAIVYEAIEQGVPLYGVTTGVGSQKDYSFDHESVQEFNERLLRAHATYIPGYDISPAEVRAALLILLNGYAEGTSGIRAETVQKLLRGLNSDFVPEVRDNCSVGAGDLVPLAQMATAFISDSDIEFKFAAKEALSLMCSNAISLAKASLAMIEAKRLMTAADVVGATTLEGFRGNPQALTASKLLRGYDKVEQTGVSVDSLIGLLEGSALWQKGQSRYLQDPLSFRCMGHIHGAAWQVMHWAEKQVIAGINSSADNPRVDPATRSLLSHGNIDSTLLTLCLDTLRQALAKVARVSAERLHKQHWPSFSGLPVGLTYEGDARGGIQFLNLSHLAEAQVAQVHRFAAPVLLFYGGQLADGVEDTAGLAPIASQQVRQMMPYCWNVIALELATAVWAIHRRAIPEAQLGEGVRPVYKEVLPMLPIGSEGENVFDMQPIVSWLKNYAIELAK